MLKKLVDAGAPERALKLLQAEASATMGFGKKLTVGSASAAAALVVAAVVAWIAIPESAETCARNEFSRAVTCPADRIEVRIRKDVSYAALHPSQGRAPSPDIAADPERYALWQQREKAEQERVGSRHDGDQFVEVRGCDATKLYSCTTAYRTINNQSQGTVRVCSEQSYPSGTARW